MVSQEERGLLEKVTSDAEGMERLRGAWEESVEIRAWLRQVNVRVLHVQRAVCSCVRTTCRVQSLRFAALMPCLCVSVLASAAAC